MLDRKESDWGKHPHQARSHASLLEVGAQQDEGTLGEDVVLEDDEVAALARLTVRNPAKKGGREVRAECCEDRGGVR